MALQPDIVITGSDSPEVRFVVEVKGAVIDQKGTEAELKTYMVRTGCPVGMLVTPAQVRFYRNRYIDYAPHTIELTAECPTNELLGAFAQQPRPEWELQQSVVEWLESLPGGSNQSWPLAVREAIEASVLPIVSNGIVRAAGPWRRRAS